MAMKPITNKIKNINPINSAINPRASTYFILSLTKKYKIEKNSNAINNIIAILLVLLYDITIPFNSAQLIDGDAK